LTHSPLEDRDNPTAWRLLLDRALPALDHVFLDQPETEVRPRWTIGSSAAIALRIGHRLSDDIDLFVPA
jgi:hypothetical protein